MLNDHQTRTVRAAIEADREHGAVVPPIHLSSNFAFRGFEDKRTYDYTRSGNPTRDQLAEALAGLEGGHGAVVTASGMAAVTLVTFLLEPEELLLAPHDCYGGCHRLFDSLSDQRRLRVEKCNFSQTPSAAARIRELKPRLVWLETPSNPLLRVTDLAALVRVAHEVGAWVLVDNTFLSPALQRPLELGADLVLHSTTKYLNGHSDVVGGAVVAKTPELTERLAWWANCLGLTGAPFDSYLTLRGLRTLHARITQHEANAGAVVEALEAHPAVARVHYPGLSEHPGHVVARRQQAGFGAMVAFELAAGARAVPEFLTRLEHFSLAESLGGVESLIAHPATMTHAAMSPEARARAGISDALLRLSIGIERAQDLIADLAGALDWVRDTAPEIREALG